MDLKNISYLFVSLIFILTDVLAKSNEFVTCGSVLKLMNMNYRIRLHSHDVKYGTGSGQQSVTGIEISEDVNSHWVVKGETGKLCTRGEAIKCGDIIRLEHLETKKNLHSHHFSSPLSGNQEISAYGDKGVGDTGDHWIVLCDGKFWERDDPIKLKHVDTDVFLAATGRTYGRPIHGQHEIVGTAYDSSNVEWKAMEGLFIKRSNFNPKVAGADRNAAGLPVGFGISNCLFLLHGSKTVLNSATETDPNGLLKAPKELKVNHGICKEQWFGHFDNQKLRLPRNFVGITLISFLHLT